MGLGVPIEQLMAKAGQELASGVADLPAPFVFLCGKGNNGGDGYAAAVELMGRGHDVVVVDAEPRAKRSSATQAFRRRVLPSQLVAWADATAGEKRNWKAGTVIDCLLGSGIQGPPRAPYDAMLRWAARHDRVVSCDIPSGLGSSRGSPLRPVRTVTFHAPKLGMNEGNAGEIRVVTIGFPRGVADIGLGDLMVGYPRPRAGSHKGDNGRVLVVGGGPFTGAPWYAGMAALRTGADLARVVAPRDAADVIQSWGPEPMVSQSGPGESLHPSHVDAVISWLHHADALVLGPGLGTQADSLAAAHAVLMQAARRGLPALVDADALQALDAEVLEAYRDLPGCLVLTPHAGEFRRLTGKVAGPATVQRYAQAKGCTVVVKGRVDLASDGVILRRCKLGHPTMTVGGTGDVLAGAIGALLAKGARGLDAAGAGLYLVNEAGSAAADLRSYGATAADVLEAIPSVLHRLT